MSNDPFSLTASIPQYNLEGENSQKEEEMKRWLKVTGMVLFLILFAASALQAGIDRFLGSWRNVDPHTRGITKLEIRRAGDHLRIRAWGKCHPTDCDWGWSRGYAYGPDVSSDLFSSAQAVLVRFRTSFSDTVVILKPAGANRLRAEVFTRFTDTSGRTNYRKVYTFSRAARLPAPQQISPPDGAVFRHYPRRTTLRWRAVPGAVSYTVEIDCYHCCQSNKWCREVGRAWKVIPNIQGTSYTFQFVGAQPGRWRVWAVDALGRPGIKSPWWHFRYSR